MTETTQAHAQDPDARRFHPDGAAPWRPGSRPNVAAGVTMGHLRSCGYCGSMHPADVAAAIREGATGHLADRKYGWPHKAYFDGVPNPHAGLPQSTSTYSHPPQADIDSGKVVQVPNGYDSATGQPKTKWIGAPEPAPATTHGKFYVVHLEDASPADRDTIEHHLGLRFEFTDGGVAWSPYWQASPLQPRTRSG